MSWMVAGNARDWRYATQSSAGVTTNEKVVCSSSCRLGCCSTPGGLPDEPAGRESIYTSGSRLECTLKINMRELDDEGCSVGPKFFRTDTDSNISRGQRLAP